MKTMSTMRRFVLLALTCVLVACGHTEDNEAQVRVFNGLYRWAAFDLFVDEDPQLEDFPYGELSDYLRLGIKSGSGPGGGGGNGSSTTTTSSTSSTMDEGSGDTTTTSSTTTSSTSTTIGRDVRLFSVFVESLVTSVIEQPVLLTADKKYTLFAYDGTVGAPEFIVVQQLKQKTLEGKLKVRVASMGPAAGIVDVYIVPTSRPITGRAPVQRNLPPSELSRYFDIDPDQYDIVYADRGTKNVVFNSGPIDLAAGSVQTLVTYDTRGPGGLPLQYLLMAD